MGKYDLNLSNRMQLERFKVDDYIAHDTPQILTRPLPQSAAIARVVYFNERGGKTQQNWIRELVADVIASGVSENYIAGISSVQRNYDLLLVSGNDPRRMNKLLRLYRPILTDKAKIAVLAHSTPTDRAQLLNGGYDDVFDLRTSAIEARCRILAHVRRYRYRKIEDVGKSLRRVSNDHSSGIGRYFMQNPTPVEAVIFGKLINSLDRPVPLEELCARPPREGEPLSRRALQVFVCRLRKKLIPGLTIKLCGSAGYLVSFTDRDMEI